MRNWRTRGLGVLAALMVVGVATAAGSQLASARSAKPPAPPTSTANCNLGNGIKHVIYVQFDNTHLLRDNPNVPSDLEQMPNLLNFIKNNGTLLTNDHTILISHTGGGILSTLTGLYPDRHGQAVSNSYGYFRPDRSVGFSSTFKYWTDQTDPVADPNYNMVNNDPVSLGGTGAVRNTPAPWVTFARAGCDVGNVGVANTVLENNNSIVVSTGATDQAGDMTKVFGEGTPEWLEGKASQLATSNTAARAIAQTDFVGIAIHCAQGGGICNQNTANARPDVLPSESNYTGYKALFGAKYVDPAITKDAAHPSGQQCVKATDGTAIADPFDQCGFPGFDGMFAKNTLGYVAQMQESGVPVTFAYISDAHDFHGKSGNTHVAFGPGEAGYVQQLKDYDKAFGDFFTRLQHDGINKSNTLFVFTVEEGDHFAGTPPDNPSCDGVNVACTYAKGHVTEVNGDLKRLVATYNAKNGTSATTDFSVHSDMAPNVYITGNPSRESAATRTLEKVMADMEVTNPLSGERQQLFVAFADRVEQKLLHMETADPQRTPSFTPFAQGDFFLNASSSTPCAGNNLDNCVFLPNTTPPAQTFAWNHGGVQPEVATTWAGLIGPGIERRQPGDTLWTDHTDIRPTMLSLLGLEDTYVTDGRVLTDVLSPSILPKSLKQHQGTLAELGAAYKQIMASFGQFSMDTLAAMTAAVGSDTLGDKTYIDTASALQKLGADRDAVAAQIRLMLWNAEFGDQAIDEKGAKSLIEQANALLERAKNLFPASTESPSASNQLRKINHIVVIYEENHSFDNLFGGWEGVNGLDNVTKTGVGDHVTQVDQNGAAYNCLLQLDVNLSTDPNLAGLPVTCTNTTPPFTSHFSNTWFPIDQFIAATDVTCPPITNAFGFANGILKQGLNPALNPTPPPLHLPVAGARPGGCTRDLVHEFYQEQYQLHGGLQDRYMSGSDSAGTTMGVYDTTQIPLYRYLHSDGHPDYAIADNFFQAAFGGSFLNHQWLIAAATPVDPTGDPGGAHAGSHSIIDSNGMPVAYPLYTPTGTVLRNPLTVACPTPAAARICGNYAVNTMQPAYFPQGAFSQIIPPQTATTIGDELSEADVSWAWYSGGWSNADGADVHAPGYTNGTSASATPTGCSDPNVDTGVRAGVPVAHWPRCPDALFQYHHQPFNYYANYAPGTAARAEHLRDEVEFMNLANASTDTCQLKSVSFVKPIGEENEHPGYASEPNGNSHLVDSLIKPIENSACAKDTLVIVTYDEFGGQWDHVSPPGQGNSDGPSDVWGPGTRIPAVVIAPHLRNSFVVDSTEHDTTSILATIEHRYNLKPLGTRDAQVADLSTAFDAHKPK